MLGGQGMIQRFRYKFIAISTAALLFVILTIVGSICTLTTINRIKKLNGY